VTDGISAGFMPVTCCGYKGSDDERGKEDGSVTQSAGEIRQTGMVDGVHASDKRAGKQGGVAGGIRTFLRAIRVHQWAKNLLLFVPIAAGHRLQNHEAVRDAGIAFGVWCLVASVIYLINDIVDVKADRAHPEKKNRPIASGDMSVGMAIGIAFVFLAIAGGAVAVWQPPKEFLLWLGIYFVLTNWYSFSIKKRLLADVLALAALYTIRILAGGAATDTKVSHYLLAFSMFLFTSLAFAKRFTELHDKAKAHELAEEEDNEPVIGRAYIKADLDIVRVVGPAAGYLAILVLTFYLNNVVENNGRVTVTGAGSQPDFVYNHPEFLYLICPLMAYWITRIWFIANRGHLHHDPLVFALKDPKSYAVGVLSALVIIAATVIPVIK
jgi:4-hydroxybenzoate polyprenyltransferase